MPQVYKRRVSPAVNSFNIRAGQRKGMRRNRETATRRRKPKFSGSKFEVIDGVLRQVTICPPSPVVLDDARRPVTQGWKRHKWEVVEI